MTGLVFTSRTNVPGPIDFAPVLPERVLGLSLEEVEGIEIDCAGQGIRLSDAFSVTQGTEDDTLVVRPGEARIDGIGTSLSSGRIIVEGDGGDRIALRMRGGRLWVKGSVGSLAGAAMAGGSLRVDGDAGDFLGGAFPGEPRGMVGGTIVVGGDCGNRAGERMRRGTIVLDGKAGAYCAAFMTGGTVAAGQGCGAAPGFGMRCGTILLGRPPASLPVGFLDGGSHDWLILRLLRGCIDAPGGWLDGVRPDRARRLIGDRAEGGRGEILIAAL